MPTVQEAGGFRPVPRTHLTHGYPPHEFSFNSLVGRPLGRETEGAEFESHHSLREKNPQIPISTPTHPTPASCPSK